MKAAEAAIAEGRFVAAERLVRQAALTADEEAGKRAEARLAQDAVSVRCLVAEDGSVPDSVDTPGNIAVVGRAY